jgi:uncharacterized ion transporter superfamily protein YfcC
MKLQIQKSNKMSNKKTNMEFNPKKSNSEVSKSTLGSSIIITLFIVFVTFKLTGVINWSWWWVTSPLWLPLASALALMIMAVALNKLTSALEQTKK